MEYLKSMKKKELRAEVERIHEEYLDVKMSYEWWKREAERLKDICQADSKVMAALRIENERLVLTPQAKIDTEAAYQRGFQSARRNLRAWAVGSIADLEDKLVTGEELSPNVLPPTRQERV